MKSQEPKAIILAAIITGIFGLVAATPVLVPFFVDLINSSTARWVLMDEFNLGEDLYSHNWGYSGQGFADELYTCSGDLNWRNRGGSFWVTLQVKPREDYKVVWQTDSVGTVQGHKLVFNIFADDVLIESYSPNETFNRCTTYVVVVTNPGNYTDDGKVVIRFEDVGQGPPDTLDFIGSHLWIYSKTKGVLSNR